MSASSAARASSTSGVSDFCQAGRSTDNVSQVSSRLIWSYWWMMKFRLATASAHSVDAVGGEHVEPRQPVRGLAQLHHQRVPRLLQKVISEVSILATLHNLRRPIEPALDVQQLFGSRPIHHNSTASRRMSSSTFGFRPP